MFTTAVDCLAAISDYFMVTSTRLNLFRLFTLYAQVRLYVSLGYSLGSRLGWLDLISRIGTIST
jgi:hypothetical protein